MKLGMYIQPENAKNQTAFDKVMKQVRTSDVDVLILQDGAYVPFAPVFKNGDILKNENQQKILAACSDLSDRLGKAVVVSGKDKKGSEFVIFANAAADFGLGEENAVFYLRHIGAEKSCYEMEEYEELAYQMLYPLLYKGLRFGLLKGDDLAFSALGRIYGKEGMDLLLTIADTENVDALAGHACARAVENSTVSLVLGTGEEAVKAYGPDGSPLLLETPWEGFVTLQISDDPIEAKGPAVEKAEAGADEKDEAKETSGSAWVDALGGQKAAEGIWQIPMGDANIIAMVVKNEEALLPEKVLPIVYSGETDEVSNRSFVMVVSIDKDMSAYNQETLKDIMKARAVENHCAVILENKGETSCFLPEADGSVSEKSCDSLDAAVDFAAYKGVNDLWENHSKVKDEWMNYYLWLIELLQKEAAK